MADSRNIRKDDRVWILGGGRFGAIAVHRLSKKVPPRHIRVIDHRRERLEELPLDVESVSSDAVGYLVGNLGRGGDPDWIVPAVPTHVLWEFIFIWLREELSLEARPPDPELLDQLPNAMTGEGHAIYTSIADFLCPDNCPEPTGVCTHTREPRPCDMYTMLTDIAAGRFTPVVVRSRQLAPGVGGYRPQALMNALAAVKSADRTVLLATACRCHGVLHLVGRGSNS